MSGWLTCVQLDAMALFQEAVAGQLTYKAVAKSNWFTAANTLCCWKDHTWLSQHQHDTIRNASLCLQGVSERCRDSRAIVVPSIDALAQDLDLDELLVLHKAWADWFYSRLSPVEWRTLSHVRAQSFPQPGRRIMVVYASSHTWMNHGSHATLRSMFPEHDDTRIEAVHLLMVGDQEIEKAGSLPSRQRCVVIVLLGGESGGGCGFRKRERECVCVCESMRVRM